MIFSLPIFSLIQGSLYMDKVKNRNFTKHSLSYVFTQHACLTDGILNMLIATSTVIGCVQGRLRYCTLSVMNLVGDAQIIMFSFL